MKPNMTPLLSKAAGFAGLAALALATPVHGALSLSPLWSLSPGDRAYLTTDNTQRGMTYNPATGNVLIVNRAGGLSVNAVNGSTGADGGTLDVTGISGGIFAASMIGAAADGAVYAGNLTVDGTGTAYTLYRWANEGAVPTVAFSGDPGGGTANRWGDTIAVRGSGVDTQILLASRSGTDASTLLTADGSLFGPTVINTDAGAGDIGLGITFSTGDAFWGTAAGRSLKLFDVDTSPFPSPLPATTNTDVSTAVFPSGVGPIGVSADGTLLGAVDTGGHLFSLWDVSDPSNVVKLDEVAFPTANTNGNGVGAVAFGDGRVFALDTNNGIMAFDIIPEPSAALFALGALALLGARRRRPDVRRGD